MSGLGENARHCPGKRVRFAAPSNIRSPVGGTFGQGMRQLCGAALILPQVGRSTSNSIKVS